MRARKLCLRTRLTTPFLLGFSLCAIFLLLKRELKGNTSSRIRRFVTGATRTGPRAGKSQRSQTLLVARDGICTVGASNRKIGAEAGSEKTTTHGLIIQDHPGACPETGACTQSRKENRTKRRALTASLLQGILL